MSTVNLPLAERKRLKKKKLTKHHLANILTHWFNAFSWGFLLATGLAPLIKWHESWGLFWGFVITFNVLVGFRRYFMPFGARRMLLDQDDLEWFKQYGRKLAGLSYQLPEQDDYNAGQKAFSYVVILGIITIIITGLIMTFSPQVMRATGGMQWIIQWAMPLHFTAVGLVVAGLVVHIYMGAIFPEERSAFFSMFSGKVDALYAYSHHHKWYKRYIRAEQAWEAQERAKDIEMGVGTAVSDAELDELAGD